MDQQFLEQLELLVNQILTWENLLQVAVLVTMYLGSDKQIVTFVEWLKSKLEWSGNKAELLVIATAVGVTMFTMIGQGIIVPESLTIGNFVALVATITYKARDRYLKLRTQTAIVQVAVEVAKVDAKTDVLTEVVTS